MWYIVRYVSTNSLGNNWQYHRRSFNGRTNAEKAMAEIRDNPNLSLQGDLEESEIRVEDTVSI